MDGLGETFQDANCLCGSPPAPYADNELAQVGAWDVQSFDLHVTARYVGLTGTYEPWEDPRNYNFASSSCARCRDRFGGKNCASTCSFCLFGGQCNFLPSTVSVRVPCNCVSGDYDSYNGCCPRGFFMAESAVFHDVSRLSTTLRNARLNPVADPASFAVDRVTFYDSAVFPDMLNSQSPSRKWCVPCPNVVETGWLQDTPASTACASRGFCHDRGVRKLWVGAPPPQYYPETCDELNVDDASNATWQSYSLTVWYTYLSKVFLNDTDVQRAAQRYAADAESVSAVQPEDGGTVSRDAVKALCKSAGALCAGITIKHPPAGESWDPVYYLSSDTLIADPQLPAGAPRFETLRKHTITQLCWDGQQPRPEENGVGCALGTTAYLNVPGLGIDLPLCVDYMNNGRSFRNLGEECLVQLNTDAAVEVGHDDACFPNRTLFPNATVTINPDTDVKQKYAPNADGIVFGAEGPFVVSAVNAPPNSKDMTPANPCSTLDGDYYWGKPILASDGTPVYTDAANTILSMDKSQCVSAADNDLACDIVEFQPPCENMVLTEAAKEHLHAVMASDAAVLPHRLTVSGIGDLELSVFKARFDYRDWIFDNGNITAESEAFLAARRSEISAWRTERTAAQARLDASVSTSPGYHIYSSTFTQPIDIFKDLPTGWHISHTTFFDQPLDTTVDFDRLLYIHDDHRDHWLKWGPLECQPERCPASNYLFGLDPFNEDAPNMCRENVFTLFEDVTCGRIDNITDWLPYCCGEGGVCAGLRDVCTPMGVRQQLDVAQQIYDHVKSLFDTLRHSPTAPEWKDPYEVNRGSTDQVNGPFNDTTGYYGEYKWEAWDSTVPATVEFPSQKFHECARHHAECSPVYKTTIAHKFDNCYLSLDSKDCCGDEINGRPVIDINTDFATTSYSFMDQVKWNIPLEKRYNGWSVCPIVPWYNQWHACHLMMGASNASIANSSMDEARCARCDNPFIDGEDDCSHTIPDPGRITFSDACHNLCSSDDWYVRNLEIYQDRPCNCGRFAPTPIYRNRPCGADCAANRGKGLMHRAIQVLASAQARYDQDSDVLRIPVLQANINNAEQQEIDETVRYQQLLDEGEARQQNESCTLDAPCDLCRGHCRNNDECHDGLACRTPTVEETLTCGGSPKDAYRYCLPDEATWVLGKQTYGGGCSEEAPCDMCHGHCSGDDQCAGDLVCLLYDHSKSNYCLGWAKKHSSYLHGTDGVRYCVPFSGTSEYPETAIPLMNGCGLGLGSESGLWSYELSVRTERKNYFDENFPGEDFTCGRCQGVCLFDSDCQIGLTCRVPTDDDAAICEGQVKEGDYWNPDLAYCMADPQTTLTPELYIAGGVTDLGVVSTWLLQVVDNRVLTSQVALASTYSYQSSQGDAMCDSNRLCTDPYQPWCVEGTCRALRPEVAVRAGTSVDVTVQFKTLCSCTLRVPTPYSYPGSYYADLYKYEDHLYGNCAEVCGGCDKGNYDSFICRAGAFWHLSDRDNPCAYNTFCQLSDGLEQDDLNPPSAQTLTFVYGLHDACAVYDYPVQYWQRTAGVLFCIEHARLDALTRGESHYCLTDTQGVENCNHPADLTWESMFGSVSFQGVHRPNRYAGISLPDISALRHQQASPAPDTPIRTPIKFGTAVQCLWWENGKFYVVEEHSCGNTNVANWNYIHTDCFQPTDAPGPVYAFADGRGKAQHVPEGLSCGTSTPLKDEAGHLGAGDPLVLEGLQMDALITARDHSTAVAQANPRNVEGVIIHEGIAGTVVRYAHAPWILEPNHPRAFSVASEVECMHKCERAHGCTGFFFTPPISGQTHHYCWLFAFDTSTVSCNIFSRADSDANMYIPNGDEEYCPDDLVGAFHNNPADPTFRCCPLRSTCQCSTRAASSQNSNCQTPWGDNLGAYCLDSAGAIGQRIQCTYRPNQRVGTVVLRSPNACGLCKSRGLLPILNTNAYSFNAYLYERCTHWEVSQSVSQTHTLYDTCYLTFYTSSAGDYWHYICPPTRAGLATRYLSTEQVVGKHFASDAPALLRLDGHPDIAGAVDCELACVQNPQCRAWDYLDQGHAVRQTYRYNRSTTPAETAAAYRARYVAPSYSVLAEDRWCLYTVNPDTRESGVHPFTVSRMPYYTPDFQPAKRLPNTSMYYNSDPTAECAARCAETSPVFVAFHSLWDRVDPDGVRRVTQEGPHCRCMDKHGDPFCESNVYWDWRPEYASALHSVHSVSSTSYTVIQDFIPGALCQRCDPTSRFDQCGRAYHTDTKSTATLVCRTATVMDPLAPCSGVDMGASYCVPALPHTHSCTLFADVPALLDLDPEGYWNGNRVGTVRRAAGTPKPAFFDDGAHPACLCHDETDTSYACNCDPDSLVARSLTPSDETWGCSGHGQCSSLSPRCHCDEGYGWMTGTCVACPAGTYKNSELEACTPCPIHTYQDATGSTACHACPQNKITPQTGSTSADDCL